MKLSENTLEILKNLSTINPGLIVRPGKTLKSWSENKNILVEAEIEEEFHKEFGIYDLSKTLGLLSMNKTNPEIFVEDTCLTFGGLGKIHQRHAAPNLIFGYDRLDKNFKSVKWDIGFDLSAEVHAWIISVASILSCPNIVFRTEEDKLYIRAMDVKGQIVDDAVVEVAQNVELEVNTILKMENLKILKGGYRVKICNAGLINFTHLTKKISYWISPEKK